MRKTFASPFHERMQNDFSIATASQKPRPRIPVSSRSSMVINIYRRLKDDTHVAQSGLISRLVAAFPGQQCAGASRPKRQVLTVNRPVVGPGRRYVCERRKRRVQSPPGAARTFCGRAYNPRMPHMKVLLFFGQKKVRIYPLRRTPFL